MAVFTGRRIRDNNVFGTTTNNPLAAGGTTLNSAALANLSALSTDHAVIVLDPLRVAGAPEIVIVTAHTASATSATITRGAYGTAARSHNSGTLWVHAPTIDDMIRIVTSGTRPSDQYEGQLIYETDTDKYVAHIGSGWQDAIPLGAWTTYTPTNIAITVGNGVQTAFYARIGRTIAVRYRLVFGSTTSLTANVSIGMPVAAASGIHTLAVTLLDAGTRWYVGVAGVGIVSSTTAAVNHTESSNAGIVNGTAPFTWTTNDELIATGTYEAAS